LIGLLVLGHLQLEYMTVVRKETNRVLSNALRSETLDRRGDFLVG